MFVCNECNEEFEEECDLGIHLTAVFGEDIANNQCKCTLCGAIFDDWGDLEMHIMWTENKGRMTGDTLKEYENAINAPEFRDLVAEMDKR